jgi:hypothetical protein
MRVTVRFSMKTTAIGLPTFSVVTLRMRRAPWPSRLTNTAGEPLLIEAGGGVGDLIAGDDDPALEQDRLAVALR